MLSRFSSVIARAPAVLSLSCRALPNGIHHMSFSSAAADSNDQSFNERLINKNMDLRDVIYLDSGATTRMDPRVLQTMLPYFTEDYGNPHSRTHLYGWSAATAVEKARGQVASLIGASPKEIVFTSGATECNNTAIKGVAQFYKDKKNHVITTQTEHKCVLDSCRWLSERGFKITYLPVQKNGLVDLNVLESAITDKTCLVSVMGVNNEIGVVQPLKEIGAICRKHGVFFHADCAQMFGKLPLDVNAMNIDLMSISGHKCYGPKGVGALYIRRKPRVRLEPLMSGGGQERGYRSGTLPTPLVVGLGRAAEICQQEMAEDYTRIKQMADKFIDRIMTELPDVTLNGDREHRWPGNINLSFSCVEGESLIMAMPNVAVSTGSACTSASLEPSYVMRALHVPDELAHTSIRFGLSRFTKQWEMDKVADIIIREVRRLRDISPLWEMKQQGIDLSAIKWSTH